MIIFSPSEIKFRNKFVKILDEAKKARINPAAIEWIIEGNFKNIKDKITEENYIDLADRIGEE